MKDNSNLTSDAFWVRTLFMIAFWFVYRIAGFILLLCTVAQWFSQLFAGEQIGGLTEFSASLGKYIRQISDYLTQVSEEKPYPFTDWPQPSDQDVG